jgi:NADH-quinone oxidoreductase subunit N
VTGLPAQLDSIGMSFPFFIPEFVLTAAIAILILTGLINKTATSASAAISMLILVISVAIHVLLWPLYQGPVNIFNDMLRSDGFSAYLKILIDFAGILTIIMTWRSKNQEHVSEYYALLITAVLGAHLLVMSINLVTVFISLELVSISS